MWIFAAAVTGVLSLGGCQPASDHEMDNYPIWWSPELGLDDLDHIEEARSTPFPWRLQFHLYQYDIEVRYLDRLKDEHHPEYGYEYIFPQTSLSDRLVTDCATLIKSISDGYSYDGYEGFEILSSWSAHCYALDALGTAKPARTSHLRDFAFDGDPKKYLPAMVGHNWDCRLIDDLLEANRDAIPWADFDSDWSKDEWATYDVIVKSPNKIVEERRVPEIGKWVSDWRRVTIYGRGDFNADGLADILIRSEHEDFMTETRASALYVVTRFKPNAVLQVVGTLGPLPYDTHLFCPLESSNLAIGAD